MCAVCVVHGEGQTIAKGVVYMCLHKGKGSQCSFYYTSVCMCSLAGQAQDGISLLQLLPKMPAVIVRAADSWMSYANRVALTAFDGRIQKR